MSLITEKIVLKLDGGTFEKDFLEDLHYDISIFLNETYIGYIDGHAGAEYIHIELIHIEEKYRGKSYGKIALENLKIIGRSLEVKCIDGECSNQLKSFYRSLGAKFECREPEDKNYILNKFYIDL